MRKQASDLVGAQAQPARMTPLGRLGELSAWAISILAWGLSYAAQVRLAAPHGFGGWWSWEALTFPLTTDLAGLVGMFLALDQARRGQSSRVPWGIAGAAAGVMVATNIGSYVGDPVAMLLHAWPPLIALASWFTLVHVRRSPEQPAAEEEGLVAVKGPHRPRSESTLSGSAISRPRRRAGNRRRVERLLAREPDVTAREAAKRLGMSRGYAGKLLAEARRPRVVEEAQ